MTKNAWYFEAVYPSTGIGGEITHLFERKGLRLAGMKMMQLTDELLREALCPPEQQAFLSAA